VDSGDGLLSEGGVMDRVTFILLLAVFALAWAHVARWMLRGR
jgi:hypothetical protein